MNPIHRTHEPQQLVLQVGESRRVAPYRSGGGIEGTPLGLQHFIKQRERDGGGLSHGGNPLEGTCAVQDAKSGPLRTKQTQTHEIQN